MIQMFHTLLEYLTSNNFFASQAYYSFKKKKMSYTKTTSPYNDADFNTIMSRYRYDIAYR